MVSLVEDNDKAVDYIQNLSEFLRYLLKGSNKEVVLIREELEMLRKYIHILEIRFGNNLVIDINIPEKFYHFTVPPLVLQILIENALKHNVVSTAHPLHIRIEIVDDYLVVANNIQPRQSTYSTGLGLKNIKMRYSFLTDQKVTVEVYDNQFKVKVPLLKE